MRSTLADWLCSLELSGCGPHRCDRYYYALMLAVLAIVLVFAVTSPLVVPAGGPFAPDCLSAIHSTVTPLSCKGHDVVAAAERAKTRRAAARRLSAHTPLDLRPSFARMAALRYYRGLPAWTRTLP